MDPLSVIEEIMEDDLLEPELRLSAARILAEYRHRKLKATEDTSKHAVPQIKIDISQKKSSGQRVVLDEDRVCPTVH